MSVTGMKGRFMKFAKRTMLAAIKAGVKKGRIKIIDTSGSVIQIGEPTDDWEKAVTLHVYDDYFWVRAYLRSDVGFSEAYMAQEIDASDMKALLNVRHYFLFVDNLYIDNLSTLSGLASIAYKAWNGLEAVLLRFFQHGLTDSILNVAGYDISNSMYQRFLSKEMQYSCPIWSELEGGVRGDLENGRFPGDLESAQATKIKYILDKTRLRPGDRLLEIGSGWGSVAIGAAKMGCKVDTLTLSVEQKELAEERIKQAGVEDRVTVHLMDYRNLPREFKKQFDAVVSLEMLEAVGVKYMDKYIKMVDWALKSDRATAVLTAATYPNSTYTPYQGNDFVRMYHWPYTVAPSPLSLLNDFQRVTRGRFTIESVQDFGYPTDYPRCLREWRRRFDENWDDELIGELQTQYPELKEKRNLEIFRRR
ncbi:hypothetical protein EIP86_002585 [Pleurotus ostreatoroseus]|nr:hypothetical protein EIP86_002585 [Pleurotus ostreatoroseus]